MSQPDQCSLEALTSLALTPREAEVLFWISQGKSNHDIGVILGAKTGTICKHVEHILGKLNVENRTAVRQRVRGSCWLALSLSELGKELCQLRTHSLKRELLPRALL
jgi:DNA-binding CsgD family transcriptional regulator